MTDGELLEYALGLLDAEAKESREKHEANTTLENRRKAKAVAEACEGIAAKIRERRKTPSPRAVKVTVLRGRHTSERELPQRCKQARRSV